MSNKLMIWKSLSQNIQDPSEDWGLQDGAIYRIPD